MPKDVGNYVGFTTDGYDTDGRLPGFWNIFDLARYSRKNLWPRIAIFGGTGGNVANGLEPGNGYAYHTFNSPGTFVTNNISGEIEILIVAGGGAGGYRIAGGGGAAGVLHGTMPVSASTTYNITVGKGGYGGSGTGQGGSPSDFYLDGASFPSPSNFARAYGGGASSGYVLDNGTPNNPAGTMPTIPSPRTGGGGAGGSSGGAGNQYGTGGYPGFTSKLGVFTSPPAYVTTGFPYSPITPAPYVPGSPALAAQPVGAAYGSDAPVPSPGTVHPSYYDQGSFPSTYYMGLQGYGNDGGMAFGPTLAGGGGGGGGAGGVGQDRGSAPDTSAPTSVTGADGGDGLTFSGFTAPLFCPPSSPVKTTLDPLGGYFAGGGGGSNYNATQGSTYGGGKGGKGGGGNGAPDGPPGSATFAPETYNRYPESSTTRNGVSYSGGGGGGGGYSYETTGGHGGPGIVIIRYLK
jgi:hypothetical protein